MEFCTRWFFAKVERLCRGECGFFVDFCAASGSYSCAGELSFACSGISSVVQPCHASQYVFRSFARLHTNACDCEIYNCEICDCRFRDCETSDCETSDNEFGRDSARRGLCLCDECVDRCSRTGEFVIHGHAERGTCASSRSVKRIVEMKEASFTTVSTLAKISSALSSSFHRKENTHHAVEVNKSGRCDRARLGSRAGVRRAALRRAGGAAEHRI